MTMTAMEHLYFTSDELEYYPNDWKPFSTFNNDSLSEMRSIDLLETSKLLKETLCDESPVRCTGLFSPLKRIFSVRRSSTKNRMPSFVWNRSMPTVHPVNQDEFIIYVSQYGLDFISAHYIFMNGPDDRMCQNKVVGFTTNEASTSTDLEDNTSSHGNFSFAIIQHSAQERPDENSCPNKITENMKNKHAMRNSLKWTEDEVGKSLSGLKQPEKKFHVKKALPGKPRAISRDHSVKVKMNSTKVPFSTPRIPKNSIINRNKFTKRSL